MHPVTIHARHVSMIGTTNKTSAAAPTGQRMQREGLHLLIEPYIPYALLTELLPYLTPRAAVPRGLPVGCVFLQLVTCLVGRLAKPTATEHETQPLTPALAAQLLQASIKTRRDRLRAGMHAASKPAH